MACYLVGCDVGTGGTKAIVIDSDGKFLGGHYIEFGLKTPGHGLAEQDPEWYWQTVAETIKVSLQKSRINPGDVCGVGLSAQSPACIMVDRDLKPLRDAHIWMDRRATRECEWLKANIGEDAIFELTGNPIDPYYGLTKLMWEKANEPDLYKRCYKMLNQKDYPLMKLTGKPVTDYSNAALDGIAFDIRKRCWDQDMVRAIGLDMDKLPDVYPCDEVIGYVTREAAQATGLVAGTPVVAGTIDANAAWLSMGVINDGENALTLGTAACWGLSHKSDKFARGMIVLPHAADSREKYFSAAALVAGGALIRWFRDTFGNLERNTGRELGISAYDVMNLEAENIPAGSDGLVILPYFMGERTPVWDAHARGVMIGLSLSHGRGHIIRALMEAVGYGVAHNIQLVRDAGIEVKEPIGLVEGGAKSRLWRQIIADITGMEAVYMGNVQGAPFGDCVVAGVGVGVFKNYEFIKDWVSAVERRLPDPENVARYKELMKVYLGLYPKLKDDFRTLSRLSA
ncbi:MAG TPA: FGGY-family carbohydrate kinase [Firmicutes bacterium]|nr:FGGY-family carbohydrate kinase [Bacillota bacterium]